MNAIPPPLAQSGFDVAKIRAQFPILSQQVRGKPLVFLDSAASAQKPRAVIAAMVQAMETQYANVHRGLHWMSERTTDAYEATRDAAANQGGRPCQRSCRPSVGLPANSMPRGRATGRNAPSMPFRSSCRKISAGRKRAVQALPSSTAFMIGPARNDL